MSCLNFIVSTTLREGIRSFSALLQIFDNQLRFILHFSKIFYELHIICHMHLFCTSIIFIERIFENKFNLRIRLRYNSNVTPKVELKKCFINCK